MERVGAVVVGAGVVGLAAARALARRGVRDVVLLEAAGSFGTGTSSRNSEVVHAGLYYPSRSTKAACCVRGRRELYALCGAAGVAHARVGKVVVGSGAQQEAKLAALLEHANDAGVDDVRLLSRRELAALEPDVRADAALLSPSTGVVDSHGLMLALLGDAEAAGAAVAYHARVVAGAVAGAAGGAHRLDVVDAVTGDATAIEADLLVNCAGLHATELAERLDGVPSSSVPETRFARGCYFALRGVRSPFSRLVYPVPEDGGLGVHATLDLAGQVRFGPDVEWLPAGLRADELSYDVDPRRADVFYEAIRSYWPGLPDGALEADYAGVRPKLSGPGEPNADFLVQDEAQHGVPGLVNTYGIESPGLTSALALAELVCDSLGLPQGEGPAG